MNPHARTLQTLIDRGERPHRAEVARLTGLTELQVGAALSAVAYRDTPSGHLEPIEEEPPASSRPPAPRGLTSDALIEEARHRAEEAAPLAERFRREEDLGLLSVTDVGRWIREHEQLTPPYGGELRYPLKGGQTVSAGTAAGSTLERLRILSEYLATRYGWHPALATTFVLTGITPPLPLSRVTTTLHGHTGDRWVSIEARADDDPEAVARRFRSARAQLGITKRRNPGDEQRLAALLAFVDDAAAADHDSSWVSLQRQWNANPSNATWRYSRPDKLATAYRKAGGNWRPKRKDGRAPLPRAA